MNGIGGNNNFNNDNNNDNNNNNNNNNNNSNNDNVIEIVLIRPDLVFLESGERAFKKPGCIET